MGRYGRERRAVHSFAWRIKTTGDLILRAGESSKSPDRVSSVPARQNGINCPRRSGRRTHKSRLVGDG
jgi:hypothetical protein